METLDKLRTHGRPSDEATDAIKQMIAAVRSTRSPFYLNAAEFERVMRWKLRGQYGRQQHNLQKNTPENIEIITSAAFAITHPDALLETRLRLDMLCCLRGVGIAWVGPT